MSDLLMVERRQSLMEILAHQIKKSKLVQVMKAIWKLKGTPPVNRAGRAKGALPSTPVIQAGHAKGVLPSRIQRGVISEEIELKQQLSD